MATKTRANILIVGLDHAKWEAYLRHHLNMELVHTDKVYYESEHPSQTFGEDISGFTEELPNRCLLHIIAMLASVQVPDLADLSVFTAFGMPSFNAYGNRKIALGNALLTLMMSVYSMMPVIEQFHKRFHGSDCLFKEMKENIDDAESEYSMFRDNSCRKRILGQESKLQTLRLTTLHVLPR